MSKRDFENIKVPKNIDEVIDKSFEEAYDFKNKGRRKKLSGIIVAALLCLIMIGSNRQAIANIITDLQKVFLQLENRIDNNGEDVIYGTSIGDTVSSNGIDVTLKDIIYNGELLYVEYRIKSEEPFIDSITKANGEQILYEHKENISFDGTISNMSGTAGIRGKFIDEYTFEGVEKYEIKNLNGEVPDNFEFEVLINLFRLVGGEEELSELMIVGDWGFRVNVTSEEDMFKKFDLNLKIKEDIVLKDIVVTPYEIYVNIIDESDGLFISSYIVDIKDENKNELKTEVMSKDGKYNEIIFNSTPLLDNNITIEITDNSSERNLILKDEINLE